MDRARAGTGYGINPLSYSDILAWSRLRRVALMPWHVDAIISMDAMRLQLYFEKTAKEKEPEQKVSERKLTTRLFDALFPAKR
jgi:hypothetical protein